MRPILHQVRVPSLPRRLRPWPSGPSATPDLAWTVNGGSLNFLADDQTPFNVAATGPAGYAAGGSYGVDPLGTALPAGMVLTEAGSLTIGSANAGDSGVIFSYHEPGALPRTLTLYNAAVTGTLPYMATVYPLEGAVPNGQTLGSPDDATARSSVLSRWPDNSAQVMVLAGETSFASSGSSKNIRLRPVIDIDPPLTPTHIDNLLTTLDLNFGTPQSFSNWPSPLRTWWSNSQVICASYVVPITGMGAMEAIVYVHAFSGGRAFVEVVIENGKMDCNASTVVLPAIQTYTNATVSINGLPMVGSGISSPTAGMLAPNSRGGSPGAISYTNAGHEPTRAWYCSIWIGGDPQIDVTHDVQYMRKHPFFFAPAEEKTEDQQALHTHAYDTYVPWAMCRIRGPDMAGTGGDEEIGLFTRCQTNYFMYGSKYASRAVIATGIAALSLDFNWRHTDGTPPTRAQVYGKTDGNGKWPFLTDNPRAYPRYGGVSTRDASHIPAMQLMPFMCRPSPVFIELAQKEFIWNHAYGNSIDGGHGYDQVRARGWSARNYASAIVLTPDVDATRKADMRLALVARMNSVEAFYAIPWNTLSTLWNGTPSDANSDLASRPRLQQSPMMMFYVMLGMTWVERTKVLRGADAVNWSSALDKVCQYSTRRVLEGTQGEWRLTAYLLTVGDYVAGSPDSMDMGTGNWGDMVRSDYTGTVPGPVGPLLFASTSDLDWSTVASATTASLGDPIYWWCGLCIVAERDGPDAQAAWDKVVTNGGMSNMATWRLGFQTMADTQFNMWPRNH